MSCEVWGGKVFELVMRVEILHWKKPFLYLEETRKVKSVKVSIDRFNRM